MKKDAQAVYILGDFFEFWWGDDHNHEPYLAWEAFFAAYPCPLYFLPGNRDFLCGAQFYSKTHMIPIASGDRIDFGPHKIAVFHGDEPGLNDWWYQCFRLIVRNPLVIWMFLQLPVAVRKYLSLRGRKQRSHDRQNCPLTIDISRWLAQCASPPNTIIHGHLHHPVIETYDRFTRYQLSCWDNSQYSYLQIALNGSISFPNHLPITLIPSISDKI